MAHKTLIDGTAYGISGGKTLIDGTAFSIKGGKTLVDGTAYEVGFAPSEATITISKVGSLPPNVIGANVTVDGTSYSDATTVTVPIGTTITCIANWTTKYMASTRTGGTITVNEAVVAESGGTTAGTTTYEYTVQGDVAIELSVSYVQTSMYGGMTPAGDISITEL